MPSCDTRILFHGLSQVKSPELLNMPGRFPCFSVFVVVGKGMGGADVGGDPITLPKKFLRYCLIQNPLGLPPAYAIIKRLQLATKNLSGTAPA